MAILCCASPAKADLEETRSTLKFASSAKLIRINPTVNEEVPNTPDDKLKRELASVKKELAAIQVKFRQLEIESSERGSAQDSQQELMALREMEQESVNIPVWFYFVAIILCAFGMNRVLLLGLTAHMILQSITKEEWAKFTKGWIPQPSLSKTHACNI